MTQLKQKLKMNPLRKAEKIGIGLILIALIISIIMMYKFPAGKQPGRTDFDGLNSEIKKLERRADSLEEGNRRLAEIKKKYADSLLSAKKNVTKLKNVYEKQKHIQPDHTLLVADVGKLDSFWANYEW